MGYFLGRTAGFGSLRNHLLLVLGLCASMNPNLAAQALPLPANTASAGTGVRRASTLPDTEFARSIEQRVLAEVERLVNAVQQADQAANQMAGEVNRLNGVRNALLQERERILNDYRGGFFCSTCNRSRTELGGDAAFWAHIQEGAPEGRRAIPATAQQIADKEREFEPKLAAAAAQAASAMQNRQAELQGAADAREQMAGGISALEAAAGLERILLRAHESEAETQERTEIRQLDGELAHLRSERSGITVRTPADAQQVQMIDASIRSSEQMEQRIENESRTRYDRYVNEARAAEENRARQYAQAAGLIARAGGGGSPPMVGGRSRFGGGDSQLQSLEATRDRVNQAPSTILGPVRAGVFHDAKPAELPPPTAAVPHTQNPQNPAPKPPPGLAPSRTSTSSPPAPPSRAEVGALPVPGNTSLDGPAGNPDAAAMTQSAPISSAGGSCTGVSLAPDFARLAESMGDKCTCWGEGSYWVTAWGSDKLMLDAGATATIVDSTGRVSLRGGNLYVKYEASRTKAHFYYGLSGVMNHALAGGQQETTPLAMYETNGKAEDTKIEITARYCKQ